MVSKKFRWLALPGMMSIALFLSGCASEHPLDTLTRDSSPDAKRINDLLFVVMAIAILVGLLVLGAVIYMVWRFRSNKKSQDEHKDEHKDAYKDPYDPNNPDLSILEAEGLPKQTHGNVRLEIAWTIIPALILIVVATFTLITIFESTKVKAADDSLRVDVIGQQWWWEFQYHIDGNRSTPPDFVSANELVIPVDLQIPLEIYARDVIHSFWIPALNGKMDAVPGRDHNWHLEASKPGRYRGQCTEFCGLSHGYMKMEVVAMEQEAWVSWARNQMAIKSPKESGEVGYAGEQIFITNCARCHSIAGVTDANDDELIDDWTIYNNDAFVNDELASGAAPNLTHFASRTRFAGSIFDIYKGGAENVNYLDVAQLGELDIRSLRAWISNAPAQKPAAADESRGMPAFTNLSTEEVDQVIEYLMTLN